MSESTTGANQAIGLPVSPLERRMRLIGVRARSLRGNSVSVTDRPHHGVLICARQRQWITLLKITRSLSQGSRYMMFLTNY